MAFEDEVDLQPHVDNALTRINIDYNVVRSIHDCHFSVSIADPMLPDTPLIVVSEGFCELTGYHRETVVGRNCRFLNEGCDMKMKDRQGLRMASKTGRHFCAVLMNRKADGTTFMNLLDLRGLVVGKTSTSEDRWFLVGVQADVTECGSDELPLEHKTQMAHIARVVGDEMVSSLQETAIVRTEVEAEDGAITPLEQPRWIVGEALEMPQCLGG